jgi:hypothetical protein
MKRDRKSCGEVQIWQNCPHEGGRDAYSKLAQILQMPLTRTTQPYTSLRQAKRSEMAWQGMQHGPHRWIGLKSKVTNQTCCIRHSPDKTKHRNHQHMPNFPLGPFSHHRPTRYTSDATVSTLDAGETPWLCFNIFCPFFPDDWLQCCHVDMQPAVKSAYLDSGTEQSFHDTKRY